MTKVVEEKKSTEPTLEQSIDKIVAEAKEGFQTLRLMKQEEVDHICEAMSIAALEHAWDLAKEAEEETRMGRMEDKYVKNLVAAEEVWHDIKNMKTAGLIKEDTVAQLSYYAVPKGILMGIVPTTNPTSTTIFKTLVAIKSRNPIIFSFHPRALNASQHTLDILREAGEKAGLPKGVLNYLPKVSMEATNYLMHHDEVKAIIATGGPGMVKACYSSGKPAFGVGAGNPPVLVHESTNIKRFVNDTLISKAFDNGVICSTESTLVVQKSIYKDVKKEMIAQGAYFVPEDRIDEFEAKCFPEHGIAGNVVGQDAYEIGKITGFDVPETATVIVAEIKDINRKLSNEKLCPIVAMIPYTTLEDGFAKCHHCLVEGAGHTAAIQIDKAANEELVATFAAEMNANRIIINQPTALASIGGIYNNMTTSFTLGCGSAGGNSISHNATPEDLIDVKIVANRRNNMQWQRQPAKIFTEPNAINYLSKIHGERFFIVADKGVKALGMVSKVEEQLRLNRRFKDYTVFTDVEPDPSIQTVTKLAEEMEMFNPDTIIAIGGGSVIDAAKTAKMLYDSEFKSNFFGAKQRFLDIRKRVYKFPDMSKSQLVAIETSASTGSSITPFAVVSEGNIKYPLADYELTPDIAISDPVLSETAPKSLMRAGYIDIMTHAIEAYTSIMSTEYTSGMALQVIKGVFDHAVPAYNGDVKSKHILHDLSLMAGITFGSSLLGYVHSFSHKTGGEFHLPHGYNIAIFLPEVIKMQNKVPFKRTAWSKQEVYNASQKYQEIAEYCGFKNTDELVKKIYEIEDAMELKHTFHDYDIDVKDFEERIDRMAENIIQDNCSATAMMSWMIPEIKEVLNRVK
jgi:acetaldehyde dehydrogenase/alcohol dehydrogenase